MDLYLVLVLFIVSFAWTLASLLIKKGLYYTSPFSSLFMKSLVFFLVSLCILLFFKMSGRKLDVNKSKKALRYFIVAVALTFFCSISFLVLLQDVEKLSMILFIRSVCTLFLISVMSYLFLGERLNSKQILGIIIGLVGVSIIISNTNLYKKN